MSSNFTGVTFPMQKVAPSDDAIIRRAILPDGILTGCAISYSGSTLTMAAGQLMVCGRQIRHPSSQNWAVVDATSGFARLVLSIDLSRTSTTESFDQVLDAIEYASSEEGFAELEQSDINVSGTRYQVTVCVVSLGAGGITGIVDQLPLSRVDGSGGLNFKVVGGLTQPSDPKENTIWVLTDEKITGYAFSAEAPDLIEGCVWFQTAASSGVGFNALKNNTVMVYPTTAKQCVGGAWVDVTAKTYQNGSWVDWWNGQLYDSGNEYERMTGGWVGIPMGYNSEYITAKDPTITRNADSMVFSMPDGGGAVIGPKKKIDLTNYSTLVFDGKFTGASDTASLCNLRVWSELGTYSTDNVIASKSITANTDGEITLDVSGISGPCYVGFALWTSLVTVTMRSMTLV